MDAIGRWQSCCSRPVQRIGHSLGEEEATLLRNNCVAAGVVAEKVGAISQVFLAARVLAEKMKLPPRMREVFAQKRVETLVAVKKRIFVVFLNGLRMHCMVVDENGQIIVDSVSPHSPCLSAETLNK